MSDKVTQAIQTMLLSRDQGVVADACAIRCMTVVPTTRVATAACDGVVIAYNPAFIETLTLQQVIGLLVHEMLHARFQHSKRFVDSGGVQHYQANRAMDMEINPVVEGAGYTLPPDGCYPGQIGMPPGLAWEEYFETLKKQADEAPAPQPPADEGDQAMPADETESDDAGASGQGNEGEGGEDDSSPSDGQGDADAEGGDNESPQQAGSGTGQPSGSGESAIPDGVRPAGSLVSELAPDLLDDASVEQVVEDVAQQVRTASEGSHLTAPAHLPAGDSQSVECMKAGSVIVQQEGVRWEDMLLEMLAERAGGEALTDWSQMSRRSHATGVYRPRRRKQQAVKVALVLDVSGSCIDYFDAWQSLAREMVETLTAITEVEILYHDTRVTKRDTWSRRESDDISVESECGGGTCHRAVLAEAEQLDVDAIVMFTDSESRWPSQAPALPCITVQPPGSYDRTPFGVNLRITKWA